MYIFTEFSTVVRYYVHTVEGWKNSMTGYIMLRNIETCAGKTQENALCVV
jgi:hypothetical protein